MTRRLTTEEFIQKARQVHGNKYNYSLVNYKNNSTKVKIICLSHGVFEQTPHNHLMGQGCPLCSGNKKKNRKEFIQRSRQVHGDKYDYSKVKYINNQTKVEIICPVHGSFWQIPASHWKGRGCSKCAGTKRLTTDTFIQKAKEGHGNKYDYSLVEYKNNRSKVEIVCPEHGSFYQTPNSHLKGNGCPSCSRTKRGSTDTFIQKARQVHGNKYDYSKVQYVNNKTKVEILCPEHGFFHQKPNDHLTGYGCPDCGGKKKLTTETFIQKARQIHGSKYDYSKVQYVNSKSKVEIICPQHGSFWQIPNSHLRGRGCLECAGVKKLTTETFIQRAKQVHGDRYDYSKVEYINSTTKVEIICPEHGSFYQISSMHLCGQGCPECAGIKRKTTEEFIQRAQQVHGDKYDYSRVQYVNAHTKVEIICRQHGAFWQIANDHLNGSRCPSCSKEIDAERKRKTTEEFIKGAKRVHGDKYDYSKTVYIRNGEKVEIICPQHGSFWQMPYSHLLGHGCPRCISIVSKGEQELADSLKAKGLDVIQSYRRWCPERPGLEIDVFLPEYGTGIEYNGEYWHRDREKDEEKAQLALQQGIRIITVWESEWKEDKDKVLERVFSCLER